MDLTIKTEESENYDENIMGVDLGIKVPAVCVTTNGKVKFIGNRRENKAIRRNTKFISDIVNFLKFLCMTLGVAMACHELKVRPD
ncbi:MAG: hypothetical protein ATN31_11530 [Candidatus Epulonipiscioides saccharophilum]|nr:MAG: hypothetical protein ATN31_11530 [Epulopiscium sp. AS2M-Bin001]